LIVKLGLPAAGLTVAQMSSKKAHRARIGSQVFGISLGCILGMCPLLFIDQDKKQLRSSFDDADKDGDGSITSHELSMALHRSGLMMDPDEVDWLVDQCGKTHTSLTFDEFVGLVKHWNEFNHKYEALRKGDISTLPIKSDPNNLATKIAFTK
jgi:hypothetical protein